MAITINLDQGNRHEGALGVRLSIIGFSYDFLVLNDAEEETSFSLECQHFDDRWCSDI